MLLTTHPSSFITKAKLWGNVSCLPRQIDNYEMFLWRPKSFHVKNNTITLRSRYCLNSFRFWVLRDLREKGKIFDVNNLPFLYLATRLDWKSGTLCLNMPAVGMRKSRHTLSKNHTKYAKSHHRTTKIQINECHYCTFEEMTVLKSQT